MSVKVWRQIPYEVEASEPLTMENLNEIAAWCGATVHNSALHWSGTRWAVQGERILHNFEGDFYAMPEDEFLDRFEQRGPAE